MICAVSDVWFNALGPLHCVLNWKVFFDINICCWFSIMVPNLVQKCWSMPKLWSKNEFKIAAAAILNWIYFRWLFLTYSQLYTVDLNHHTKFCDNISFGCCLMVIFENPRWRPSGWLMVTYGNTWIFINLFYDEWVILGCWCSIMVSNLVKKSWSTPKLWPKKEIQNGNHRLL